MGALNAFLCNWDLWIPLQINREPFVVNCMNLQAIRDRFYGVRVWINEGYRIALWDPSSRH